MDRQVVFEGATPLETDLLNTNKFAMVGLAKLAKAVLGTTTFVSGLACTPTTPASMQVKIGEGEIYSLQNLDDTAYGALDADTTHSLLKQGLLMGAVNLTCPAPTISGNSINYLVQAAYQDLDAEPVVLAYYNASNPAQGYAGPNNSGIAQNTVRKGVCNISVKAGIAATTGSQQTPAPDLGFVGLYSVTVAYGQTSIAANNIAAVSGAPFLPSAGLVVGGLQGNACNISAAGGTADAITGSYTPGISALTNGMTLCIRAGSANATTTPTFTPNSGTITAKQIVKGAGAALVAGDIAGNGHWIELRYDSTLDKWVLLNPANGVSPASQQAGEVCFFARNTAPTGFLKANGAAVSRTSYAALFAAIGTTFGAGDGSTTFNVPDLRGEFLRGFDDGRGVDSGRGFGSAQGGSNINRLLAGPGSSGTAGAWWSDQLGTGDGGYDSTTITVIPSGVPQGGLTTVAATGIQISRGIVRPRNIALLACIKY